MTTVNTPDTHGRLVDMVEMKQAHAAKQAQADPRERESLTFGMYDRLYDHGNCLPHVVLAPVKKDGSPDWAKAHPTNLESLPGDIWPDDAQTAARVAVLVDDVEGCSSESSFLLWIDQNLKPVAHQIAGPADDKDVADAIIVRDIGAEPRKRDPGKLSLAAEKLSASFARPTPANDNAPPVTERLRRLQQEFGGTLQDDGLYAVAIGKDVGRIYIDEAGDAIFHTTKGLTIVLPEVKPVTARPFSLRDPATLPARDWLFGRHYIRRYLTSTLHPQYQHSDGQNGTCT